MFIALILGVFRVLLSQKQSGYQSFSPSCTLWMIRSLTQFSLVLTSYIIVTLYHSIKPKKPALVHYC